MKKTSFFIVGKHAVTAALKNPKRKVLTIFLTEDSKKKLNRDNPQLNSLKNVKIFYKTKKELDNYCSKDQLTHQGLVAEVEHLEKIILNEFIKKISVVTLSKLGVEKIGNPAITLSEFEQLYGHAQSIKSRMRRN